jgi:adenine-specific DNA-methyltransferase
MVAVAIPAAPMGDPAEIRINERDRRKATGAFYTPPRMARLLARWALEGDPSRILEPSFGDGVFLKAAYDALSEEGIPAPASRLTGVEIDPDAARRVCERIPNLKTDQLHCGDLLSLEPALLGEPFEAILGNPPYIRHHRLTEDQITRGRAGAQRLGVELNGRSDAWAYFCAHLLRFLAPGGRMALVLPGAVLHAEYARPLLDALASDEGETQLLGIGERLFPGVQERTVVLLLDRSRRSRSTVVRRQVASMDGLGAALRRVPKRHPSKSGAKEDVTRNASVSWGLTGRESALWGEIEASTGIARLGSLAQIRIGVVTGANDFFVRTPDAICDLADGVDSVPIVSRGRWLARPRWTASEHVTVANEPSRLALFASSPRQLSKPARDELARAVDLGLDKRSHCRRRSPWYVITDTAAPDIFLPYMGSDAPRLVVNESSATCTNAIHRVVLHEDVSVSAEVVAAASWTTLYRLSAELFGRSYGGGVLKLEPSGAAQLRISTIEVANVLDEIDETFRSRGIEAARRLADRLILKDRFGVDKTELAVLSRAADRLRQRRKA